MRSATVYPMTTQQDLAGEELLVTIAETTGRTVEEVALDFWELDQAGLLDELKAIAAAASTEAPRNRAERRQADRRRRRP